MNYLNNLNLKYFDRVWFELQWFGSAMFTTHRSVGRLIIACHWRVWSTSK